MKRNVLIIGAGGVAKVVAHKCAQHNDELGEIAIASRNINKCHAIIESVIAKKSCKRPADIQAYQLNALDIDATKQLIRDTRSQIVINVGSAFLNMSILRACIDTGASYIDTAIHEDPAKVCETPPWYGNYEWKHLDECKQKSITAILGIGFDPGVVNAWAALAQQQHFDQIESLDILDVNAGSHGRYFATNFDPEINFREFTGQVWSWQNAQWTANKMFEVKRVEDLPLVGKQSLYLTGHDEVHSLSKHLQIPNIRFWMSFGDHYIHVFNVLKNLGLLSEKAVKLANGQEVVPLQLVKAVLPDPASLAANYRGNTCIANLFKGKKNGQRREMLIYNLANHEQCYKETESQAISYTAGVPAVAAARLIAGGDWDAGEMCNVEQLPPVPFLKLLDQMGLPTRIRDHQGDVAWDEYRVKKIPQAKVANQ